MIASPSQAHVAEDTSFVLATAAAIPESASIFVTLRRNHRLPLRLRDLPRLEFGCDDVEDVILRRFPRIRRPGKVRGRAEEGEATEVEEGAASTTYVGDRTQKSKRTLSKVAVATASNAWIPFSHPSTVSAMDISRSGSERPIESKLARTTGNAIMFNVASITASLTVYVSPQAASPKSP